jgi:hypothetical protein
VNSIIAASVAAIGAGCIVPDWRIVKPSVSHSGLQEALAIGVALDVDNRSAQSEVLEHGVANSTT